MARRVRDSKLDSRTARQKLDVSGKPYYKALDQGLHLGYRKGKTSGKWLVRIYGTGEGDYLFEPLGLADDTGDPNGADILNFSQAQKLARQKYDDHQKAGQGGG